MLEVGPPTVLDDVLQHFLPDPDVRLEDEVRLHPVVLGDLGHVDQRVQLEGGLEMPIGFSIGLEDGPHAAAVDLADVFVDRPVLLHQLPEADEPFDGRERQHAAFQGSSPNLQTSRRYRPARSQRWRYSSFTTSHRKATPSMPVSISSSPPPMRTASGSSTTGCRMLVDTSTSATSA